MISLAIATALFTFYARAADAPTTRPALVVPATVEAFETTDMYAKTSGYVKSVRADIGDHVKAGDVLAEIDVPELQMDLLEAKATLVAKRKMVDASDAAVKQAQIGVQVAQHQLKKYKADADFQNASLKRQEELVASKAITNEQLDEMKNKAAAAQADVGVAQSKVAAAEADLVGAQANHDIAAAQAEVAEAQIAKVQTLLAYTRIIAPYSGTITRRMVNTGELVQPGNNPGHAAPLFTVQRAETVRVFCDVPEAKAAVIKPGTPAAVRVYASATAINGKVTRMSGAVDRSTGTFRVEIDLPNPDHQLIPGMYAQVTLTP
jgi:multidrug resistance efflux pump